MINTKKLRAKIIENGFTYAVLAEKLHMSGCTFGKKIRNRADMSLSELVRLSKILSIPVTELSDYFFDGEFDQCAE